MLKDKLLEIKKFIDNSHDSEEETKLIIILTILEELGWNWRNPKEVKAEYFIDGRRVDYALLNNGNNKVYLEIKKNGINLENEEYQKQLLDYSSKNTPELAILSNGKTWFFYLPTETGGWRDKRFFTIDIKEQNIDEVEKYFLKLLSKENILNGSANKNAKEILKNKLKNRIIEENLPKAFKKIINDPDELLVELLSDVTEKMCGYKPEDEEIMEYLKQFKSPERIIEDYVIDKDTNPETPNEDDLYINPNGYQPKSPKKRINYFIFKGKSYSVRTFRELLIRICDILINIDKNKFMQLTRYYNLDFNFDKRQFGEAARDSAIHLKQINMFLNIHGSAITLEEKAYRYIQYFGYKKNDLTIKSI